MRLRVFLLEEIQLVGVSEDEIKMQTALGARVSATSMCHVRDVVLLLWEGSLRAGEIWSLVDVHGIHLALIALWDPVDRDVVRFCCPMDRHQAKCCYRSF